MAGTDGFDGKGTIWVHDSPVGGPEREAAPPPPAAPVGSAEPPVGAAPVAGPPLAAPVPTEAPKSGLGSTGCLVAMFAFGGIGLGLVVLLGLGLVGAVWWMQAGM